MMNPMSVSPERDEYFPILYSTVASQKSATIGTDLNSERARSEAIKRARAGNIMATAQNIQLRNPIGGQRPGLFAVLPVYRKGVPHGTVDERRENTLGVIVGAFQTAAVFDAILNNAILPKSVDLYLYPSQSGTDALPVYMRGAIGSDQPIEAKPQQALAGLPYWATALNAGDASWNLVVVPRQAGLGSFYRAWLVLAAVLLVFGALLAYMWASLRHALRLETANSRILELAQTLRQLGTKIAIDDFGTGYSSLKYLTQYPVNRLKLAQEFVFRVTVDYRNAAVVRAAIRLANELGIEVIAEGVETEAQARFLIRAGCEQAQGYYFSQPVPVLKATELLRAGRIEPSADPLRRLASSAA